MKQNKYIKIDISPTGGGITSRKVIAATTQAIAQSEVQRV